VTSLDAIAHHEAAHAVLAVAATPGIPFESVSIVPTGYRADGSRTLGRVRGQRRRDTERNPEGACVSSLAGVMAERLYSGEWAWDGCWTDACHVVARLDGLHDAERTLRLRRAVIAAADLVAHHWHRIRALAGALVERGTLDYDQALAIMVDAEPVRRPRSIPPHELEEAIDKIASHWDRLVADGRGKPGERAGPPWAIA
jgi:hypothetical protein